MFSFRTRPGYKSKNLLIEFLRGSGSDEMVIALKNALKKLNCKTISKEDCWMNDEFIYNMNSQFGEFEISSDSYGEVFIIAETNQIAILEIEKALIESGEFEKEEADFSKYE